MNLSSVRHYMHLRLSDLLQLAGQYGHSSAMPGWTSGYSVHLFITGLQIFLINSLTQISQRERKFLMPAKLKLPDGNVIFTKDTDMHRVLIDDLYVSREYEALPDYVARRGWIIIDVGACIGLYSLHVGRIAGKHGHVLAFEVNPNTYYWLQKNIELNKFKNVQARNIALGDSEGGLDFYIVERGNVGASSPVEAHIRNLRPQIMSYRRQRVPVTTLDSVYYSDKSLRGRAVDLVKIDVEGYELKVLRGMRRMLREKHVHRFVIEVHLDVIRSASIQEFLRRYNYALEKSVSMDHVKEIRYYHLQ